MRWPCRLRLWTRRLRRDPYYITDLFTRFDNWTRPKEYL